MLTRALVTGGSGALGQAICRRLARDGLEVIVHAHRGAERAGELVRALRQDGGAARMAVFDLSDEAATRQALESLLAEGPVQVLVHNAGTHADAPLAGMNADQWRSVIEVSLNGFYHVLQPLLLPMLGTRWGRIVAMSSVAGVMGNRGQSNYAAAKAGLHGAVKSLALELAPRGITVNAVAPGIIAAGMGADRFDAQTIKTMVPMKRAGTPEEVAALVGFLASREAGYISAQVIGINGAMA